MEFSKLIPQVFFDILARFVPGALLFGAWVVLLGGDEWSRVLDALLGGHLNGDNAVAAMSLVALFLSFLVGYVLAPIAKQVQRMNERLLLKKDPDTGERYDQLRAHRPDAGALCAKIRAEFTMHNALSVAFVAVAVMSTQSDAIATRGWHWFWALASLGVAVLMAWRGATTEETFQQTTRKLFEAYEMKLPQPRTS
jgi:hypothetical protein